MRIALPRPRRRQHGGPWLFEPFAKIRTATAAVATMSAGQQHGEQHPRLARTGVPNPVRHPETKRVKIRRSAKRGYFRVRVAPDHVRRVSTSRACSQPSLVC